MHAYIPTFICASTHTHILKTYSPSFLSSLSSLNVQLPAYPLSSTFINPLKSSSTNILPYKDMYRYRKKWEKK